MLRQLSSNQVEALRDVPFKETRFHTRTSTGCLAMLFVAETSIQTKMARHELIFTKNLVHSETEEFAMYYNEAFKGFLTKMFKSTPIHAVSATVTQTLIIAVASAMTMVSENTREIEHPATDVAPILPHGGRRPTKGGSCFETTSVSIEEFCYF